MRISKNNVLSTLILLSLAFFISACSGSDSESIDKENLKKSDHKAFIQSISKEAGPTEDEIKNKTKVAAADIKEDINRLIQETKNLNMPEDSINFETVQLSINWLILVDRTEEIKDNNELKTVIQEIMANYSDQDKEALKPKLTRVVQIAKLFTDGNPSIVGLVRNSNTNPNEIPFVYPNLEEWYKVIVG